MTTVNDTSSTTSSRNLSASYGQDILRSSGFSENMDVGTLVEAQIAAEFDHQYRNLTSQMEGYEEKLQGLELLTESANQFQAAIDSITDFDSFENKFFTLSDEWTIGAQLDPSAAPGDYHIEVDQLAKNHSISTPDTNKYSSRFDTVGVGTLTLSVGKYEYSGSTPTSFQPHVGNSSVTLDLDSSNNSLEAVAEQINQANIGISAQVVDVGDGFKLSLTSQESGTANEISIDGTGDLEGIYDYNADAQNMAVNQAAQNARVNINGLAVESSNNEIEGAIEGVSLSLYDAQPGKNIALRIGYAHDYSTNKLQEVVDAYNALVDNLDYYQAYSEEQEDMEGHGLLQFDSFAREMRSQLQNLFLGEVDGQTVNDIGIEFDSDFRHLTFDSSVATKKLEQDVDFMNKLFGEHGEADDLLIRFDGASERSSQTGSYEVEVTQLATHGSYTSAALWALPITLVDGDNSFTVVVDGEAGELAKSAEITLEPKSYASVDELVAELQQQFNHAFADEDEGVTVAVEAGALVISSNSWGSQSSIEILSNDPGIPGLLGIDSNTATRGVGTDVQGKIGGTGTVAYGEGQDLVGLIGDSRDIRVTVEGGALGQRGSVNYSHGVATLLDNWMNEFTTRLSEEAEQINSKIEALDEEEAALDDKKQTRESALLSRYSDLLTRVAEAEAQSVYIDAMFNKDKED